MLSYIISNIRQIYGRERRKKEELFSEAAFCLASRAVIIYGGECRSDFSGCDPEGHTMVCKMLGPFCSQSTSKFKPDSSAALRRQDSNVLHILTK